VFADRLTRLNQEKVANPRAMRQEIFRETLGGNPEEARHRYLDMSDAEREAFDHRTRVRRTPGV